MDMAILFGTMMILILVGVPIGYAIGCATALTIMTTTTMPISIVAQQAVVGCNSFPLMAIPFFILAGNLMTHGGIAERLINFFKLLVGRITGGLGMVSIITSLFFGAITGSAMATASAVGAFMIPAMEKEKYETSFAASLVGAAGTIGIIIPPSIPFVVYGVCTGASIGELFIAGVIPGILMALAMMTVCYIIAKKNGLTGIKKHYTAREVWDTFRSAIWALISPIIVLGGIYGGIFTPTEAAVVSVVYSLIIGLFVYKDLNRQNLYKALYNTMIVNGITVFMVGLSTAFAVYLSISQIPVKITNAMLGVTDNSFLLLVMINIFLLIVGCLIDNVPACIILAPILLPVVEKFGMSDIQFGVVLTLNLAIGFITPPYGPNLFVTAAVANISVEKMYKQIMPFIVALLLVLGIVTYIPAASMFLVDLMKG